MTGIRAQRLVVGVDDTHASRAALAFAMREAGLRGSALEVITAWTLADEGLTAPEEDITGEDEVPESARRHAQQIQDRAVALTLQEVEARPLLSRQVIEGDAGQVLLRGSRDADYLVVGTAAKESVRRKSLGSVSEYCLRHATCAVVLVQNTTSDDVTIRSTR